IPLIECASIQSWAREFNQCAFVITVDSGPMHLADALDVPVIALFGQGKLPLWAPSGRKSVAIAHRDAAFFVCHPIVANTDLGRKYMNLIRVEEVLTAADRITATPLSAR
ncbi:MAG TPA: glycosyltransferase family 9 protein, partial [Verrucomicrobiae bacterium]|nr:glycosyltransferase family 9 protein [Verrucomicrobiae bacterium]